MAEALVVKLTLKGMPRQKAYEHVRMLVSKSLREDRMLKDVALEDKLVRGILDVNEITSTFNYREYLGSLREIYSRTKDYVLSIINSCSKYWSR